MVAVAAVIFAANIGAPRITFKPAALLRKFGFVVDFYGVKLIAREIFSQETLTYNLLIEQAPCIAPCIASNSFFIETENGIVQLSGLSFFQGSFCTPTTG